MSQRSDAVLGPLSMSLAVTGSTLIFRGNDSIQYYDDVITPGVWTDIAFTVTKLQLFVLCKNFAYMYTHFSVASGVNCMLFCYESP